uniref:Bridge-like lipid transfer protein family member 1 C-terminal domain-containing protein n=1 Tax=Lutzomyia longipalpis TaxID=7200 RepID=A0A1B0CX21_LUTLO
MDSQESSSDSPSLSSTSFISALSSQEDITLVNLHMQVNRPIVDSPLLMASYVTHLAQVRCTNWSHCSLPYGADSFSMPLFQQNEDGGLVYIGGKMVPHFDTCSNWREVRILTRSDPATSSTLPSSSGLPKSHPWDPSIMIKNDEQEKHKESEENEFISPMGGETATRNSVVVRCKGQADVMVTPLLLEGLQRMIESLTPTLATLHPLTIINYLHGSCIRKVEAANILKRDQSLSYWSQVHSNSKRSTAERNLQGPGGPVLTDVYEESISTQLQGLVVLPKISVSMIQSSVVEEVISFAALDNVQDLSCASLLVVCFDSISTRFHFAKTTKASMHTFTQPAMRSGGLKKGGIIRGTTRALLAHLSSQSRPDNVPGEPVLIEASEKQLEELVVTLDIGKAHAQLRRLKNDGCALQENQTIVTAIPAHRSRAMFECTKYPEEPSLEPFGLGFIMFEGGLEGIGVKIVKRSQFEKSENAQDRLKEQPAEVEMSVEVQALAKKSNQQPASTSATDSAPNTGKLGENRLSGGGISKKPLTPKPSTPKEKLMMGLDFNKSRDKESGSKDGKTPQVPQPKPSETVITVEEEAPGKEGSGAKAQPAAGGGSTAVVAKKNDNGKTSSCIIDLKTVWFNFAAPPRVPITRKIDYTRLDWNLLSTASPAITAWMNPSNRFAIKLVSMMKAMHQRRTAVAASLMADGLEVQGIHRPPKSRYSRKLTPLSKTLQEDPSCQLCTIMQKYILQESVEKVEANLKQQDLPQLNVLRQGVIVLSRQWKNTLYNPMLFEHQYKNKLIQPVNVAFSMQPLDEDCDDVDDMDTETYPMGVINDSEETERTMLLGQGVVPHRNVIKLPDDAGATSVHNSKLSDSVNTSPSLKSGKGNRKKSIKTQQSSTRHSSIQMFPIISGFVEKQEPQIEYGTLRDGSLPSICSSSDSLEKAWSPPPNHKEDLYSWMAKQQHESEKKEHRERHQDRPATPVRPTGTTTVVQSSNGYVQDSVRLLDAHLIFEPLLSCLGVMPQQMVNNNPNPDVSLDSLGTNLSLVGSFDTLRIDIVVSEAGDKKPKAKIGKKSNGKFVLTMPPETPAFLCERVGVEIEVLKMADGFPEDANPNVLYLSRGQLKKHTSTVINFSLNIRYISQQVNMPLLRLLHQITNMYQNVKEAQNELREQPETGKRSVPIKDESSLASEMNDPTLLGSIHEPISQLDSSIMDEHYDKFNESYPIGHSISRTRLPSLGPLIPLTPSPSSRNRPQSFAQKLRSTSKSVKGKLGYINLTETVSTPIKTSPTVSTFEQAYPALQRNPVESKYSLTGAASSTYGVTPKCWKTIYHLLNLYATMPETKTVCHRVSVSPDAIDNFKSIRRSNIERKSSQRGGGGGGGEGAAGGDDVDGNGTPVPPAAGVVANERTRLVVFGVAKIHRTRLLATLSGLKLEAEITALQSSATWRKKSRPAVLECSLTGHIGRAMIVLLEGVAPSQQTVVKVTVGKSQTLYSSVSRRGKDKNSGLLSIGPVNIDIPQHPKWKRPSMRRSMLKTANRSRSFVIQSPTKEDLLECGEIHLPEKVNDGDGGSLQSSPHSGPSRSASLKMRIPTGPRVTFTDTMRQSSLPSADSEMNFHDGGGLEWPSYDSSMQEIPHMLDIDGEQVELRKKSPNHPVKQQDPNVDFELDIKVLEHWDRLGSPVPPRRNKDKSRLRYNANHTLLTELTIFHIPGLDVKLNYQSKTIPDDSSPRLSTTESFSSGRRLGSKRASLFAWMTLQSIPEETIISPHILEFLEQTLEPIPKTSLVAPSNPVNIDLLQGNYVAYASFPVDVIVYFHMQPSTFRFSCLPVSRVECMLQLPSLDIVFSSKRQESGPEHEAKTTSGGGLSVTGCLADFNVYIFHPYGGKKSGIKEAQFSPLADSERKDSLSINVEFVKFHLTRSRTVNYESLTTKKSDQRAVIRFSTIVDIGSASFKYDMRRLTEILAFPKAWYRHSIVRRLFLGDLSVQQTSTGDLDFTPSDEGKGYTKSVGGSSSERSPLLKEKLRLNFDNDVVSKGMKLKDMEKSSSLDSNTSPSEPNQVTAWETLVLFAVNFKKLNVQMNMGNVMGNVVWLTKAFRSEGRLSIGSTGHKNMYIGIGLGSSTLDAKGGIEEPGCQPHHMMGIKFLALELRLDYMGTSVLMKRISSLNAALEDKWENSCDGEVDGRPKKPPVILIHGDLSWDQLQVLISKSTTADLLKMFYKLEEFFSQQFKSSKRVFSSLEPRFSTTASGRTNSLKRRQMQFKKRTISVTDSGIVTPRDQSAQDARHHRHWQKPLKQVLGFYLPSFAGDAGQGTVLGGTMELHGNNISLACFHGINFKSKSWALFSLRDPCINFATEAQPIENTEDVHINQTLIFSLGMSARTQPQSHSMATVCRMTRNIIFPPQFKTLHEWFHYAFANSEIDSVDRFPVLERERPEPNTNSIEKVRQGAAGGGPQAKSQDPNHNREVIFALPSLRLQFKTEHMQGAATPESSQDEKPVVECSFITEFEDHIFVTVDADAFFFLHDLITSYLKEKEKVLAAAGYARSASPNVPTASGSNASQGQNSMGSDGKLAAGAAADADGTMVNGSEGASMQQQPNLTVSEDKAVKIDKMDMEAFVKDWRDFVCRTWHLEPTVRLLSWAGKSIEPYGIDYILNKLGFSHARTTIPKWLQRGFMDPLDKLQALMMLQLLSMVKENRVQNN